jgi:hypothetical protein
MKKGILAIIVMIMTMGAYAQTTEEVDLIQAAFGIDKKEIVMNYVKPNEAQKAAFMEVYNEYETERKELGKVRIELLKQYADQWENMTNEQADEWIKKVMALGLKRDKLIKKYYNKVKSVTNAKVATQFYQIEAYILTTIRYSILEAIPFVDEKK